MTVHYVNFGKANSLRSATVYEGLQKEIAMLESMAIRIDAEIMSLCRKSECLDKNRTNVLSALKRAHADMDKLLNSPIQELMDA